VIASFWRISRIDSIEVHFLTTRHVVTINARTVGVPAKIVNQNVLDSAVAAPQAMLDGEYAYASLYYMGGALLRSLAQNIRFSTGISERRGCRRGLSCR
jgi:hypothetical protein